MKTVLLALLLSHGADAVSSHVAMQRGGHELVLTQHSGVNAALLAGTAVTSALAFKELRKSHPRWAWGLVIVDVAVHGLATQYNLRGGA